MYSCYNCIIANKGSDYMLCVSLQLNSDFVYIFSLLCVCLVKYGYIYYY